MTDTLRPPPYRPRPKEGEPDREEKLTEGELKGRDRVIRTVLVVTAVGVYSGLVVLLSEILPGGGYPWPMGMIPSFLLWPLSIVLAIAWSSDRKKIVLLFVILTVLAGYSVVSSALLYSESPFLWFADFPPKLGS